MVYGEVLPGADFNKQVYEFDGSKPIWDQNDYEERVKVEAEMMVALEALKESVLYLGQDIKEIVDWFNGEMNRYGTNGANLMANHNTLASDAGNTLARKSHIEEGA